MTIMKRIFLLCNVILLTLLLVGCGWRERLLAPPDEYEIPSDSLIAQCTKEEDTFTFIYKDDGVYQYSINDVIQSEEILDTILEEAFLHGSSMDNYLLDEFSGTCIVEEYIEE